MEWNKVWAIGRDNYIRFYPNPGIGVRLGSKRLAISLYGGVEIFASHPTRVWERSHAYLSRVKRPGGK